MHKKIITGSILGLAVIAVAGYMLLSSKGSPPTVTATPSGSTASNTFTMAQVAQHADAQSCYTAIEGSVYDLTKWIPQHPGGEGAILSICGKDGTAAFTAQHDHRQQQQQILASFKIGTLAP